MSASKQPPGRPPNAAGRGPLPPFHARRRWALKRLREARLLDQAFAMTDLPVEALWVERCHVGGTLAFLITRPDSKVAAVFRILPGERLVRVQ